MDPTNQPQDDPQQEEVDWPQFAGLWLASIDAAQKADANFTRRGKKIVRRYRSERPANDAETFEGSKFNLFWSNVQTLGPATYSRRPRVVVQRRFRDQDPVARLAGLLLQRVLQYEVDCGQNFHKTMESVVQDRLLPGRGVAWVRYEPSFKHQDQQVPSKENPMELETQQVEVIATEKTPIDYVYWEDFLSSPGRVWADVTWVARCVPFTEDSLKSRFGSTIVNFGGKIEDVSVNYDPTKQRDDETMSQRPDLGDNTADKRLKRALVWEIWDKERKQVVFVAKGCQVPLDVVMDKAQLEDFFPCPEPLCATQTNDRLTPVADYIIYQEQLRELDDLTSRIGLLQGALRIVGTYDASQPALKDLLSQGFANTLVPVNAWAAFAEKGGLKGSIELLPLDMVAQVLEGLHQERERVKQTIYELTGMADIIRGASVASETLGAQQIKAKFANLRLSSRQQQAAGFVSSVLWIKAQLVCNHYSPQTIVEKSSAQQILEVQQHPDHLSAAIQLLKDQKTLSYRIDVEEGSMIELDEVDEHQRLNEFMSTVANFFNSLKNIAGVAPEMFPVALEMFKFVVRRFHVGVTLENVIEDAIDKIIQRIQNPKPPQPDPDETAKIQSSERIAQLKENGQTQRNKVDNDTILKVEGMKIGQETFIDAIGRQHDMALEKANKVMDMVGQHRQLLHERSQMQAEHSMQAVQGQADRSAAADAQNKDLEAQAQQAAAAKDEREQQALQTLMDGEKAIMDAIKQLADEIGKPRKRIPTYDKKGDIVQVDDILA